MKCGHNIARRFTDEKGAKASTEGRAPRCMVGHIGVQTIITSETVKSNPKSRMPYPCINSTLYHGPLLTCTSGGSVALGTEPQSTSVPMHPSPTANPDGR